MVGLSDNPVGTPAEDKSGKKQDSAPGAKRHVAAKVSLYSASVAPYRVLPFENPALQARAERLARLESQYRMLLDSDWKNSTKYKSVEDYVLSTSAPFVSRAPLSTKLLSMGIVCLALAAVFLCIALYTVQFFADVQAHGANENSVEVDTSSVSKPLLEPAGPPSVTPVSPPPADAQIYQPSIDGAIATMRYFYQARDYALATGDAYYLETVIYSGCLACNNMVDQAKTLHGAQNTVKSGLSKGFANQVVENPDRSIIITATYNWDGFRVVDKYGKLVSHAQSGRLTDTWLLKNVGGRYLVMAKLEQAPSSL